MLLGNLTITRWQAETGWGARCGKTCRAGYRPALQSIRDQTVTISLTLRRRPMPHPPTHHTEAVFPEITPLRLSHA